MQVEEAARADGDLIQDWIAGDESAAAELVRRHWEPVSRFLAAAGGGRGGGGGEDVEDIVQETFVRAFRRIETFRGGASFRTWVMTIGSNLLKDRWRQRKRRQVVGLEDREIADVSADPAAEAVAGDMLVRLEEALPKLPRLQRDVFLLRAQQGLEYGEIAEALGTTPGAARVHYHHAVKRLKTVLS